MPTHQLPDTQPDYRQNRSIEATVQAIYAAVKASPVPLTRLQIARAINRHKTPHLIQIIEEMVRQGWLERTHDLFHNGVIVYLYSAIIHEGEGANQ
ncbi:MAG TPA: hypothetical protein VHL11_07305 [Phototrophicaceae bacterium]|jgi:hypothetical protein|nr:hypothetical protein [Phototrophicaceae bacterium]